MEHNAETKQSINSKTANMGVRVHNSTKTAGKTGKLVSSTHQVQTKISHHLSQEAYMTSNYIKGHIIKKEDAHELENG